VTPVSRIVRTTLVRPTRLIQGIGLHSGRPASVLVRPAPSGTGLIVVDSASGQEIPATAQNVVDTSRCTQLGVGGIVVQTVEHVLSALAGCGVDDAVIESFGGEMPAVDGSARPFADAVLMAGVIEQPDGDVPFLTVGQAHLLTHGSSVFLVEPSDAFRIKVVLDYPSHAFIGTQVAVYSGGETSYIDEIAPARTYGFLHEVEALRSRGLALGASADNALVLSDDGYATRRRFDNELARHKLLDMIGDLALAGRRICAQITAIRPGHAGNTALACSLLLWANTHVGGSGE